MSDSEVMKYQQSEIIQFRNYLHLEVFASLWLSILVFFCLVIFVVVVFVVVVFVLVVFLVMIVVVIVVIKNLFLH